MPPMLRAVIDTNLIVRSVIKPAGSVGPILQRLRHREYLYLYSRETLREVAEVLGRSRIRVKYGIGDDDISAVLQLLILRGELITPHRHFTTCRDSKDNMFLDAAVEGLADALVTGDEDLLTLGTIEGIPILSPRDFLLQITG